jgi:ABC-type uncharacterized transport system involved in gliding motility auxiliary subunit
MTRIGRIAAALGVVLLALGLVFSLVSSAPSTFPGIVIAIGVLLIAAWPILSISTMRQHGRQSALRNTSLVVGSVLVLLLLGMINFLAARHTARWDTTRTKRYSLSQQTKQILNALPQEVEAFAFFQENEGQPAKDILQEYSATCRQFSFRMVDPDRKPEVALKHKIREYGTIILTDGSRSERITSYTEQDITSALVRLGREELTSIWFLSGHGERSISDEEQQGLSALAEALSDENYEVGELLLLRDGIPPEADVIIVAGASSELLPSEGDSLAFFIARGGRVLICLEQPPAPGFEDILSEKGVSPRSDMIVDASGLGSLFGMSEVVPLVASYDPAHPITKDFSTASFFPLCRSLAVADTVPGDSLKVSCVATTSEASWGETDPLIGEEVAFSEEEDVGGPLCVAAAVSWPRGQQADSLDVLPDGRLLVFGDIDFASNGFLSVSGNRDLVMNAISWLVEREELIGIRPKPTESSSLILSAQAARSLFFLSVLVLPGAVLLLGISVWLKRR